jgi:hypothetical protein
MVVNSPALCKRLVKRAVKKAHRGSMTFFQVFLSHTRRIFGNLTCIFVTIILQAHQIRQRMAMTELQSSLNPLCMHAYRSTISSMQLLVMIKQEHIDL